MANPIIGRRHLCGAVLLLLFAMAVIPVVSRSQMPQAKPIGSEPSPEPAVPAILTLFDKYEVVTMPAAHGMKDIDDFIFLLIRNPAFSQKVNDIVVECGNSLYQPILDRYIAGEDVPFADVRKVWRDTTQSACGVSGFYEQLFPLVRAINHKLPQGRRLRVLAGDSPIDWEQIKSFQDILNSVHRDVNIATLMEKEVLGKHRKALMLFGTFHTMHRAVGSAVSIYEKDYPNLTYVISDLGYFDADLPTLFSGSLASWPIPSLARSKGTWLGALDLSHFLPPPLMINKDECIVRNEFPKPLQKSMEDLVDAFLYLGPQDLRLVEPIPADIALDIDYRMESMRRDALPAFPGTVAAIPSQQALKEWNQGIVKSAENPIFVIPKNPPRDAEAEKTEEKNCLERKNQNSSPKQ